MTLVLGGWDRLLGAQAAVARRVIEEESRRREHLVVYLSGAHAYGFPSPDSDLDLKCVHVAPTEALLGLTPPEASAERMEVLDGVEVDYGSNEVGHVLRGLLGGNGNYLERVAGECALAAGPGLGDLRALVPNLLSKRYYKHYRGFALNPERGAESRPTAKRFLYVLRTALTGAHLLATGEVVTDLIQLADAFRLSAVTELVERKRTAEQVCLEPHEVARFSRLFADAFAALDGAHATSGLPVDPPGAKVADDWLQALRRARLA